MNPIKQLVSFAGIGVLNSGIDALLYLALTRGFGAAPLTASALSFLAGSLNSFLLNKRITFADPAAGRIMAGQYVKFLCVTGLVLGVHQISLALLHHQLGAPDVFAKAFGMLAGMLLGFRLNRRWVFRLHLAASKNVPIIS
jgi:putative flippase GtrA